MATVANEIDRILNANPAPAEPAPANRDLLNLCSAPGGFKVSTGSVITPASITFDAVPLAMPGAVVGFSATGGTITTSGNRATLTSANATSDSITVTATVTFEGVTYTRPVTIQKIYDGAKGDTGTSPNKTGTAYLYQWSVATPAKPNASSTFTWSSAANTAYAGTDGWYIASSLPANPGTPGMKLFVASISVTDAAAATTTSVPYTSSVVTAYGSNGANGVTGVQSAEAAVYRWEVTIPTGPTGSPTFTWSSGLFGAAPTNWTLTPDVPAGPGLTLWKAVVRVIDTASATTTGFNWTAASITPVGSSGLNGTNGTAYWVDVSTSAGQVFSRADSAGTFAPASITLTATPYGGTATYQWQYLNGATWTNIAGATAATTSIASGSFAGSRVFRVQATIGGTVYTDEITLVQVTGGTNGTNAVVGFLTNESVTLAAGNDGTVPGGFASAGGTFKIFDGLTDKTGNAAVTYSVFAESGVDVSIAATGVYSVVSMGSDTGTATLRAVYNGVTIDQTYSIAKAKAGASTAGAEGASYVTAYCASATASTTTAPVATVGKTSVPAVNGGGITGTWTKTVPALTSGQFMYQTDGIYNPANDTVTWSIPYWSALKVGSLSAISANFGQMTAGSIDLGSGTTSWHVDSLGNMWAGNASFASAPFRISNAGVGVMTNLTLKAPGGQDIVTSAGLQPGFEAPGTKNSDLIPRIDSAAGVKLFASANIGLIGNSATMLSGTGWGEQVISAESFTGGAYFSAVVEAGTLVFGLNSDPNANASFDSIDHGLYAEIGGKLYRWYNGASAGQIGTWTPGDVLSGIFDGSKVVFQRSGTVLASVPEVNPTAKFYFDSSFLTHGSKLSSIRFTPMSDVSAAIAAKAAADAAQVTANDAVTGLADKLSKTSAASLAATITVATGGSILAGTTTNGAYMSPNGFYGVVGGAVKFSIPIGGDPTFGGTLTAPSGTLGSLHIPGGGGIHGGAWTSWSSPAAGAGTGFYVGDEGIIVGNYNDGRYVVLYKNGDMAAPGFSLVNKQLTLTSPIIVSPNISGANLNTFTVTNSGGINSPSGAANVERNLGSRGVTVSGAYNGSLTYSWSISSSESSNGLLFSVRLGPTDGSSVTVYAKGQNDQIRASITCIVTDGNGISKGTTFGIVAVFGTGAS